MSEEASGAISGAASGASAGAAFGPWGAVIGGVVGGIGGFLGGSKAKKRRQAIERQINELRNKVAESVRGRLREVDKLTDEQMALAEDNLNLMLDYYAELKLNLTGIYERNSQAYDEQYGGLLEKIEESLTQELGIQQEVLDQFNTDIDGLYSEVRDFVQADLAYNKELKEEFRTDADKAIRDTWEASDDAKLDLQNLKDSGGRPENFDRVVAENAQAFGDIQNQIDRSDARRGRSDLTGKKLTAKFAEAMAKGNIAGQMGEIGQRQEQALRGEITGLGNTALNQQMAKLQGSMATEGQTMADLATKFEGRKIDENLRAGYEALAMEQDANKRELMAQELNNRMQNEIRSMLDQGLISADEAMVAEQKFAENLKMQIKGDNWKYKDQEARAHEGAMLNTISSLQGQAQAPPTDYAKMGGDVFSAFSSIKGGMGGGNTGNGVNNDLIAKGNYNAEFENALGGGSSSGGGGFWQNLFGKGGQSTTPANPYYQRNLGRYNSF